MDEEDMAGLYEMEYYSAISKSIKTKKINL